MKGNDNMGKKYNETNEVTEWNDRMYAARGELKRRNELRGREFRQVLNRKTRKIMQIPIDRDYYIHASFRFMHIYDPKPPTMLADPSGAYPTAPRTRTLHLTEEEANMLIHILQRLAPEYQLFD